LIIAILLCCNNKSLRMLAWASIPIALLNVNETLLFGIPIIFSLRLGIPFLLVPLLNVAVGVLLTRVGVLHPAVISVPLNTPMFANSFIATDGQWLAPVLQLGITVLGAAVYAPFVRTFDRQVSDTSTIELRSLDTTYSRLSDDSSVRSTDPLLEARRALTLHRKQATVLEQLGDYNFCLHYQPQVSNRTGEMVSCEALLRARDACGNSVSPAQFIPWLEAAGLQSDVDLWVAKSAMAQYLEWQRDGIAQTISINLSGATMNDLVTLDTIIEIIEPAGGDISVEITEHALVENSDTVQRAITHLHEAGIKVIIDDFGTGYSALGYLHQYAIDGIKIDRSFVTAAATSRGLEVLRGLFHFADSLHLDLVVEGVETESQLKMLGDRNLVIQGWYYAAALCAEDLIRHWHRPWGSTP
jgi:EAL domain-containing protein (putative c-di-GMP-specific phosphodiesterase class I)